MLLRVWIAEYRRIFSDFGVLLIFFGAIGLYSVFYPMPYRNEIVTDVPVAVVDHDRSDLSRKMIQMSDATQEVSVDLQTTSFENAVQALHRGEIYGIIVIPEDFAGRILRGEQAVMAAHADAGYFLIYRQIMTGVVASVKTFSAGVEIQRLTAKGLPYPEALNLLNPLPLLTYPLFNPSGGYASYVVPAAFIIILQQTLLMGIGMLVGTKKEVISRNTSPGQESEPNTVGFILGKTMAYLSLYMVHVLFYLEVLHRFYRFPHRGNIFSILGFAVPFLLATCFLGMLLSKLFHQRETSLMVLGFTSLPILFLSGFAWPVESMPGWLHNLSLLIPSTAGVDGFLRINQMGASLKDIQTQCLILWALTIGYFLLVCILSKRPSNQADDPSFREQE